MRDARTQPGTSREGLVEAVRTVAAERYGDAVFRHREWYIPYHIRIVEQIAGQLLEYYPTVDRCMVACLVWLHDIGKTLPGHPPPTNAEAGTRVLAELGFDRAFCDAYTRNTDLMDAKRNLAAAPLEVQVVSSADGCAHLFGPFMAIYWKENSDESVETLIAENQRKASVAWDRKITLPEARSAFAPQYRNIMQWSQGLPERFL